MNIVLAPGFLGFDRIAALTYFAGVEDHLRAAIPGVAVLATTTSPFGSIQARAALLESQIATALADGRLHTGQPVHVLAHSMGGLDARCVAASRNGVADRIATIVCIGTPHLGTSLANLFPSAHLPLGFSDLLATSFTVLGELRRHTDAVNEVTPDALTRFNEAHPDNPRVRYINVVGTGRAGLHTTSQLLVPTYLLLNSLEGPNDGVVSVASASARGYETRRWAADHVDLIGHDLDAPASLDRAFDHLTAYRLLVQSL